MIRTKRDTRCQALVKNACRLLRAAGLRADPAAVIEVVRSAPVSIADADAGPSEGLCARCLLAAEAAAMDDAGYRRFEALAAYFLDELPALSPHRRLSMERDVVAVLSALVEA